MNDFYVFDIETDGLLDTVTKIHCLSVAHVHNGEVRTFSFTDMQDIKNFFTSPKTLVGHKIITYDIPVVEKILGIKVVGKFYDSLGLSWYLYPHRFEHGLESWGDDLGIAKPVITDWENQSIHDYLHRCNTDVQINLKLFFKQLDFLIKMYGEWSKVDRLMSYLSFKLDCAREQEEIKWRLDIVKCEKALIDLEVIKEEKFQILSKIMPQNVKYKIVSKPAKMFKKDGTPSSAGIKWFEMLDANGLSLDYEEDLKVIKSTEVANPNSHKQLKDWLFSLGWIPRIYNTSKSTGEEIPQVSLPMGAGICKSVKELYSLCPDLESLEGLYIVSHRIGIFKGFLRDVNNEGFIMAQIKGFTNTLRFQHTTLVNLPSVHKLYSEDIRGSLIAPTENHVLCGSDMSSLEDSTKQHYMYFFDPEYVKEMRIPGFDPHLDIAVLSGLLTNEQAEEHKLYSKTSGEQGVDHSQVRKIAKQINFAGVYGAGPPKIAKSANIPLAQAQQLHKTYWSRNIAVKRVSSSIRVKQLEDSLWLFNPVSQFWYSLRVEKDKFSTLNQGTGVYCFDSWVRKVRNSGLKVCGQFHDEIIVPLLKGEEDKVRNTLLTCIDEVNKEIKLNIELGISVDFGNTYAEIH